MPTQKNLASWDLQLGFNLAFKRLKLQQWISLKMRYFKSSIKTLNDSQGQQIMLCLVLLQWQLLAKIMNHSMLSSLNTEY
jgi:hypothetical protein